MRVHTLDGEQLAWVYVLDAYEGGLPSARYLGIMADAAEAAGAPDDYVADLRARPCRSIGPDGCTPAVTPMSTDAAHPTELAAEAAAVLARADRRRRRHDVALVLGSGWVPAADAARRGHRRAAAPPTCPASRRRPSQGHAGRIRSVRRRRTSALLVFLGRTHLYEGRGVAAVVHGVRTAAAAGCRAVVLTNGCGGLRPRPGRPAPRC